MTETLLDADGRTIRLGRRLGSGGEGDVYEIEGAPDEVAKVLFRSRRREETHDKVRAMIARPPPGAHDLVDGYPVLTWPRQMLYRGRVRRGAFAGYTMRRIEIQRDFVPLYQVVSAARRGELGGASMTWDRLLLLALRISHVVRTLHRMDYAVGDLNDRNILVSRRLTPLFLDTDSFEVPRGVFGRYPCHVGDRLYWPPELLGVDLANHHGSRSHGDRYALAVLVFQLLLNGMRPYQARGREVEGLDTLEKKTLAGVYPWPNPRRGRLEPPAGAPDYRALPRTLRRQFEAAFVAGHRRPRRRPSADDWYRLLKRINADGYETCPRTSLHRYARTSSECPWCLDPNDPFRAPGRPPMRRPAHPWTPRRRLAALARGHHVLRDPKALPAHTLSTSRFTLGVHP